LQAAEEGLTDSYTSPLQGELHDWAIKQHEASQGRTVGIYAGALGFGYNKELLAQKGLPEPKCWADLIKPEYKGEIGISHPASSGTAYTIIAGLVQQMGEDAAFDYLKKLHKNTISYTRSGQAQAPDVAKGEVAIGVSFLFGFEKWRYDKFPVKTASPCEGTGYEIGGIALVKGARNKDAAIKYYDWLMSPAGQAIGAKAGSFQTPANKTFKPDPRIPSSDGVKLIKYDFEKYGKAAERRRLIDRWTKEVEAIPR
jgi:iron(III) transport system substrate-binding protein